MSVLQQFNSDGGFVTTGNVNAGNVIAAVIGNSATYLYGDGSNIGNISGSNYGNSNVATFLADFGSNTVSTAGNVTGSNVNSTTLSALANVVAGNAVITNDISGASLAIVGNIGAGNILINGLVCATGNIISLQNAYIGNGAAYQVEAVLGNAIFVAADVGEAYVQAAMVNTNGNGSADWVAYANNGNINQGWVDIGFTGNTFNDPDYTVTAPNDGYVLAQGTQRGNVSLGGNLILATGDIGNTHDIIFATGGFQTGNIKARLYNSSGTFSVVGNVEANNMIATTIGNSATYLYGDGSNITGISATANTGNVTFSDQTVIGTGDSFGAGGLYLAPGPDSVSGNVQYFRVRGGDVSTHLHFDTGNNAYYDQFFGDDYKYVQLANTGNIIINSNQNGGPSGQWIFNYDSQLILAPTNVSGSAGESALFRGTRRSVNGVYSGAQYAYSATLAAGGTPTVAYTATNNNVQGVKVTFAVQSTGSGFQWEQFDVMAVQSQDTPGQVNIVVSNRVKAAAGIGDTQVTATINGSSQIEISLNLDAAQNSGGTSSFDAVEFGLMVD
jgi:hypothetical protein